jgi:hypothetical protein
VPNLRLLYTSRHIEDISGALFGSILIDIRASDEDIRTYVLAQIKSEETLFQICEEDTHVQDEIAEAIVSESNGMLVLYMPLIAYALFYVQKLTFRQFFGCSIVY